MSLNGNGNGKSFTILMVVLAGLQSLTIAFVAWVATTFQDVSSDVSEIMQEIRVKMENHERRLVMEEWWTNYHRDKWSDWERDYRNSPQGPRRDPPIQ